MIVQKKMVQIKEEDNATHSPHYTFYTLEESSLKNFTNKQVEESLRQWDMLSHAQVTQYRFDEEFKTHQVKEFLTDLLCSKAYQSNTFHVTKRGTSIAWSEASLLQQPQELLQKISHAQEGVYQGIRFTPLPCTVTDVTFFDPLYEARVVNQKTQTIQKCFDQYITEDGICISDLLRQYFAYTLLQQDGMDHLLSCEDRLLDLFSLRQQQEFLFHIMTRLCIGGPLNQFEDSFEKYLQVAKLLYKDLVRVHKNGETNELEITSKVYQVQDYTKTLFARDSTFNFCYVSVDAIRRHVTVWQKAFIPVL